MRMRIHNKGQVINTIRYSTRKFLPERDDSDIKFEELEYRLIYIAVTALPIQTWSYRRSAAATRNSEMRNETKTIPSELFLVSVFVVSHSFTQRTSVCAILHNCVYMSRLHNEFKGHMCRLHGQDSRFWRHWHLLCYLARYVNRSYNIY